MSGLMAQDCRSEPPVEGDVNPRAEPRGHLGMELQGDPGTPPPKKNISLRMCKDLLCSVPAS